MNVIRLLLAAGSIFYAGIFLVQVVQNGSVAYQALAGIILLIAVAALAWMRDELALKRYEMGLLWVMVLGFLVYAVAHLFGVVA
ncbi:MAG: hypothetical protein GX885_09775 [Methanomicrobiales archaeon]|nr:hypothetical protein [Methanomicrobiales archaeon]